MYFSSMESKNKFVNNVISKIYDPSINDDHASEKFWLDTGKVLPIIAHMFPSFVFVVYDEERCTTNMCKQDKNGNIQWGNLNYLKVGDTRSIMILYNGYNHFDNLMLK